jgi:2-succinyl-5-enolpyruvyl-6-hydroxy-3-cyclohexene-1-carboxylate synthase
MTEVPAMTAAAELVGTLIGHGVTDFVVSPGARSQALALTVAALAESGDVRLHVRLDERVAAFVALGLAVESGLPAPLITTSGSAVANLLPAIVEAHHAGIPMIALTADRPARLRGTGANQTTIQPGMFGSFVKREFDVSPPESGSPDEDYARRATEAFHFATTGTPGPVHVNLQFSDPLSSAADETVISRARAARESAAGSPVEPSTLGKATGKPGVEISAGERTLVIAGADAGSQAENLAHAGGWPLIAEVTSGARFGRNLIVHYRPALEASALGGAVERVIVFGHPTLSRQVPALLERPGVNVIRVERGEDVRLVESVAAGSQDAQQPSPEWLRSWQRWDRRAQAEQEATLAQTSPAARAPAVGTARSRSAKDQRDFVTAEVAAARAPVTRELLVLAVWRATWPHDRLVFGASRLIRVADASVPGKKISVHANRGLSGIDGNIGTAVGIALAAQPALTRILLGDVAALHDAGSMIFPTGETRPRIQVIVGNDGGGSIFDELEVAHTSTGTAFDRVMFTPHQADFGQLALAFGWRFIRVVSMSELESALIGAGDGPELIEVVLER